MPKSTLKHSLPFIVITLLALTTLIGCGDKDTVKAYHLGKVNPDKSHGHEWLPLNVSTYRVNDGSVVREIAGTLDEYQDCKILSKNDWECTYPDGFGSFGFRNGNYWERPGITDQKVVGQLEYNIERCKWCIQDEYDGVFWGSVRCVTGWE